MDAPYTEQDIGILYGLIGKAVWNLQHLENVVVSFTAMKILQAKRAKGWKVTEGNMAKVIEKQRHQTLGLLIGTAKSHKTIPPSLASRFDVFLEERNWLIHRCVVDEYQSLRNEMEKQRLFRRIATFSEEAIALRNAIHNLFEQWFVDLGYDLGAVHAQAEQQLNNSEKS